MSDIGRAIYFACSALLFIFATTASVYLYGTLNANIDSMANLTNVYDRAEGEAVNSTPQKREITWGEIYITIMNMQQMHVDCINVKGKSFSIDDSIEIIRDKIDDLPSNTTITSYEKTVINGKVVVTYN